jgi:adenosine deaminase CECR1
MPKGALLHAHLDATVNVDFVLELALKYPNVHIRTSVPISADTIAYTLPEFRALPELEFTSLRSITDPSYPANGWVPLRLARENFALGGPAGFDKWYVAATTINPAEAYGTHNTITKVRDMLSILCFCLICFVLRSGKNSRAPSE